MLVPWKSSAVRLFCRVLVDHVPVVQEWNPAKTTRRRPDAGDRRPAAVLALDVRNPEVDVARARSRRSACRRAPRSDAPSPATPARPRRSPRRSEWVKKTFIPRSPEVPVERLALGVEGVDGERSTRSRWGSSGSRPSPWRGSPRGREGLRLARDAAPPARASPSLRRARRPGDPAAGAAALDAARYDAVASAARDGGGVERRCRSPPARRRPGPSSLRLDRRDRPARRRGDLGVDLVGRDLDHGLALFDRVAVRLVPFEDRPLGDRLAHLGHHDLARRPRRRAAASLAVAPSVLGLASRGRLAPSPRSASLSGPAAARSCWPPRRAVAGRPARRVELGERLADLDRRRPGLRILTIVPLAGAGTSASTLSVETSTTVSSFSTHSPSCLCHSSTVPSVTDSPIWGIWIWTVAVSPFRVLSLCDRSLRASDRRRG